jgi:tetratricopeptide (TPR) repeat protein
LLFPALVLVYLAVVILFLYIGPASFTGSVISQNDYGTGTRAELFARSLYFLKEFPFTGGGLSAFPGLYSYYVLDIPIFYLPNSHNLFLDVAIEQGIFAGLSYLLLYVVSVWFVSRSIIEASSVEIRIFSWLVLFALMISIVHGMVDDYLYNGNGALLSLFLMGISTMVRRESVQSKGSFAWSDSRIPAVAIIILIVICVFNFNKIRSAWYADLGAVQMGRVELAGFPTDQWAESTIVPQLEPAEISLRSSLRYDSSNPTANYRLGMISMLRQDFKAASVNLEIAHDVEASHRGIVKNLGYCYAWLGEMDKAKALLQQIPEAHHELSNYAWWWSLHGREDLAKNASELASQINSQSEQP